MATFTETLTNIYQTTSPGVHHTVGILPPPSLPLGLIGTTTGAGTLTWDSPTISTARAGVIAVYLWARKSNGHYWAYGLAQPFTRASGNLAVDPANAIELFEEDPNSLNSGGTLTATFSASSNKVRLTCENTAPDTFDWGVTVCLAIASGA